MDRRRIEENRLINQIREHIGRWRELGWPGITSATQGLLEHWTNPERECPLFFCQIEALEAAISLGEAARNLGDSWTDTELRTFIEDATPACEWLAAGDTR